MNIARVVVPSPGSSTIIWSIFVPSALVWSALCSSVSCPATVTVSESSVSRLPPPWPAWFCICSCICCCASAGLAVGSCISMQAMALSGWPSWNSVGESIAILKPNRSTASAPL